MLEVFFCGAKVIIIGGTAKHFSFFLSASSKKAERKSKIKGRVTRREIRGHKVIIKKNLQVSSFITIFARE
jgi:hypothetical protein